MIKKTISASFFVLLLWQVGAQAVTDDQLAVIRELGSLNGIALHCNGLAETQRIKRALVSFLPKRRQLGELFDHQTNQSFMAFMKENASCPSPQTLAQEVDESLRKLESVYSAP
ncbi:MAG: hypothetical protein KZQ80_13195 [Candidatus Thiodiazotropha sp. (ex Monitilora ramsayi)]|nr:hypothetical protein [Candidatus Thiodiazotropha sp. (ex Monitilora ramsayi)]